MGSDHNRTHDSEHWQLGGSAPELYQRYLVPAVTGQWAADLVERAALQPGERVLDVACGTGVVARLAAARVGPSGRVAALDLNPGMLAVARALPGEPGEGAAAVIEWYEGSALALPFPDASFEVSFCQLGLQFFPDRPQALQEMRRVLAPAGRLALSVFGPIEHNPATCALATALDHHLGADAARVKRTEHALADPEQLRILVAQNGFRDVVVETLTKWMHFPSPIEYVRIQLAATPLASFVAQYDATAQEQLVNALVAEVGAALGPYVGQEGLTFPQEVHCVLATR
jgi:ubiquinone/menaquinone biosynthesis C-methylase UbiE